MERKLATIRKISEIHPIEGADQIELVTVDGWKVVVAKNVGHRVGDMVVYCEVDSFLPIRPEFEFLRKTSYKKMGDDEGFRLRTIKLRGVISQGLILPLSILEGEDEMKIGVSEQPYGDQLQLGPYDNAILIEVGVDVTTLLGIQKYEPPIPAELSGQVKGRFPSYIPKTDEERVQNLTEQYQKWSSDPTLEFYVAEKLDGTSATYFINNGEFGICSRNYELQESDTNTFWKVSRELNIERNLREMGGNYSIQGELIGEGVQGNPYKIKGQTVRIFSVFDIDNYQYLDLPMFVKFVHDMGLETVPILAQGYMLPDTIEEIIVYADGKSVLKPQFNREGIVIRSRNRSISFKVISNKFLLKHEY